MSVSVFFSSFYFEEKKTDARPEYCYALCLIIVILFSLVKIFFTFVIITNIMLMLWIIVWFISITVQLNTTLAFICISIILSSAWLIISLVFCRKRLRKEMKGHKIIHICTAMLLGMYSIS